MHSVNKFKFRVINYNMISKTSKMSLDNFNPELPKINLLMKNRVVNGQYITLASLFSLFLLTNSKGTVLKSRKNNLYLNLKKNDNIGTSLNLKKRKLWDFYLKIVLHYLNVITIKNFSFSNSNTISFKLTNLHIIDEPLSKEIDLQHNIDLVTTFSTDGSVSNRDLKLFISHIGFPFNN